MNPDNSLFTLAIGVDLCYKKIRKDVPSFREGHLRRAAMAEETKVRLTETVHGVG